MERDILVLVSIKTGYFRDSTSRNLLRKNMYTCTQEKCTLFNHSPTKRYLECFRLLIIINNAEIKSFPQFLTYKPVIFLKKQHAQGRWTLLLALV